MSKRTRYADNSRRQQPVQQQRAQAAQQASTQKKLANGDKQPRERSAASGRAGR